MKTWHGYPIPGGVHPQRPWWFYIGSGPGCISTGPAWMRVDGRYSATGADLAAIDRSDPIPAPGPLCGQVWRWPDGSEGMVIGRNPSRPPGQDLIMSYWDENETSPWPPPGAILVAGPGSPWAPPEYEPEEVKP